MQENTDDLLLHLDRVIEFSRSVLPTPFGQFNIRCFRDNAGNEIPVLDTGIDAGNPVWVRLHSSCITGDIFFSRRCDCREQLTFSMRLIAEKKNGMIIYLPQEGRGIGFGNKIAAYSLQDDGIDTYAANTHLGFPEDAREYSAAVSILNTLGVKNIHLITNNPDKVHALTVAGINVISRVPCQITPGEYNHRYIAAKKEKGHILT